MAANQLRVNTSVRSFPIIPKGVYKVRTIRPEEFNQSTPEEIQSTPVTVVSKSKRYNESSACKARTAVFDDFDPQTRIGTLFLFSSLNTEPDDFKHRYVACGTVPPLPHQPAPALPLPIGMTGNGAYVNFAYRIKVRVHFGGSYHPTMPLAPAQTSTRQVCTPPPMFSETGWNTLLELHNCFWNERVRYTAENQIVPPPSGPSQPPGPSGPSGPPPPPTEPHSPSRSPPLPPAPSSSTPQDSSQNAGSWSRVPGGKRLGALEIGSADEDSDFDDDNEEDGISKLTFKTMRPIDVVVSPDSFINDEDCVWIFSPDSEISVSA